MIKRAERKKVVFANKISCKVPSCSGFCQKKPQSIKSHLRLRHGRWALKEYLEPMLELI